MVGIVSTRHGPALIKRIGWEGLNSFVLDLFLHLSLFRFVGGNHKSLPGQLKNKAEFYGTNQAFNSLRNLNYNLTNRLY